MAFFACATWIILNIKGKITSGEFHPCRKGLHTVSLVFPWISQEFRNSGGKQPRAAAEATHLSLAFFSPPGPLQGLWLPAILTDQTKSWQLLPHLLWPWSPFWSWSMAQSLFLTSLRWVQQPPPAHCGHWWKCTSTRLLWGPRWPQSAKLRQEGQGWRLCRCRVPSPNQRQPSRGLPHSPWQPRVSFRAGLHGSNLVSNAAFSPSLPLFLTLSESLSFYWHLITR